LEQTAQLFGIQRSWLEGATNRIYVTHSCYKNPAELFRLIRSIRYDRHSFPLRALTTCKAFDYRSEAPQPIVILLAEKLAATEDVDQIWDIDRYHILDEWDWSYPKARIQLKAMVRLVDTMIDERVPMFRVSPADLKAVCEGRRIPRDLVTSCLLTNPSLEDYTCSAKESAAAKETDELPWVLDYISEWKLENLAQGKFGNPN
ncbi:MAG: hypothetical protein ABIZ81_01605, partial [Opitutaceae bacterium]